MRRSFPILVLSGFVVLWLQAGDSICQVKGTRNSGPQEQEAKSITLTRGRYYRFEVQKLRPLVSVVLVKQWVFEKDFPAGLLEKMKAHSGFKKSRLPLFANEETQLEPDTGYIRWQGEKGDSTSPGALLWYLNGTSKELVLYVDFTLDHTLAEEQPPLRTSFGPLRISADLKMSRLSGVEYGNNKLSDQSNSRSLVQVQNSLHVSFSGSLSDQSAQSITTTDTLMSGEMDAVLDRLRQVGFNNESHHGITLGWLGYQQLRHGLVFLRQDKAVDFEYTVSGDAFPLLLVRRQLQQDGWPLVLRGKEYVGRSEDGLHVFRPVECNLSRVPENAPAF